MNETQIGQIFETRWLAMGMPRTALFQLLGFAKNGNAKGLYLDAGATRWLKHSVKPSHFDRYKALPKIP